ncbi:MAG: Hsp20/alpha crystallin family protein [Syntrophaceae bacterium]|nr:Hsp20/alpha crystallin family protein [Syntrophaceae bacterium]
MKSLIPWRRRNREVATSRRDDFFDRFFRDPLFSERGLFSEQNWYPSVDVSEGKKEIMIKAEIPGVDRKDIDISLDGRFLTIKGQKKHEKEESDEHYHRVESAYGYYQRTIELPAQIDASGVDATYKDGILKLKLKKLKAAETKKIEIKTT